MPLFPRFSISIKVTLALSIGLAVLLALGVFGYYSFSEFRQTQEEMRRLLLVRENLEVIRRDVERAEELQIRYRLSADPADQREFLRATERVQREIDNLRTVLVAADQKIRLDKFQQALRVRFAALAASVSQPGPGGQGAAAAPDAAGDERANTAQEIAAAIAARQGQMAVDREDQLGELVDLLLTLALWGSALAVALLLWTIIVINRYELNRRRVESDLENARERLAFALEGSNSAAWDWDIKRNEIYLSASWPQLLGAKAQETTVTAETLLGLVHPDDLSRVRSSINEALAGNTADYHELHRVSRVDGDWIWILSRGTVVRRDDRGRALRIAGINQDVTRNKAMELALQEHAMQLQLALAAAGMVRWEWDVASDEFTWPEDPSRLAGPSPRDGYLGLQDMVHPEDLVHFIRALNHTAQTGEPYRDQYRLTRTDGTIVWVSARGYAVRDADARVVRVVGVAQDVSEIKQAEQALRASERELRLITDAVPAFISYADANEVVRFCNKALATFVGTRPQELIGRQLRQLYEEEVYAVMQPYVRRALSGEKVQFQRRQKRRDGAVIDLEVSYIPRRGILGEVDGFYALLTDITELKRLDRMKSEFVSTVSHELRTPLTSIRGSLGILAGGVAGPLSEKVKSFIDIAKDNCERLIRLINDILEMEKIESGKMTFQLQVLDLTELVERTVRANEGFAAQHGVRLRLASARPGVKVNADSDRLTQVLTNLISNACKFSPAQSSVDIALSERGERIRVDVMDHGPGISEAFRARIFQKFSQEDSTDMRQKGGTGLGLSISRAIIEGMGGEIGFDTEIGKGSTFYFDLPLWREPAAQPLARSRLLICEDDVETGKRLQFMAEKAGYDSDLASTVAEARQLLGARKFDALTLGLNLTSHDALALIRELRDDPVTAGLPVIVLSADWGEGRQESGDGIIGVVDWLRKPIDEGRLIADLQSVRRAGARPRILHVEDDADVRNIVATIAREVAEFDSAGSVADARAKLERGTYDLVLLDLGLPDGSGWDLLPLIERLRPPVGVVIFSAQDAGNAGEALPYSFLVKSQTSEERLIEVIREAVNARK